MILDSDADFKKEIPSTSPREFVTFRRFTEESAAKELMEILKQHDIEYNWSKERDSLDGLYGDKVFKHEYIVRIVNHDFLAAEKILLSKSKEELDRVGSDHYLFSFTNEELIELVSKPDEWSEFDFLLAQRILKQRGVDIKAVDVDQLKKERLTELARPDKSTTGWIYAGYFFALTGGLLGLFIGWHLSTFKKLLPNGQKVYGYDVKDRSHGNRILLISIAVFLTAIILGLSGVDFS
jgi:hypothetical protein